MIAPSTTHIGRLQQAVFRTVAYSDIFDYPLTFSQLHRYLEGITVTESTLREVVAHHLPEQLTIQEGYITFQHRLDLIEKRKTRATIAKKIWPKARRYGEMLANLPYVRMVAVTGSLAMDNSDESGDIDYFIVTENNRLWLTRAMVISIVRLAGRSGIELCPNYLVTQAGLQSLQQSLYTAREMTQMVPLAGLPVYDRMRQLNRWAEQFLPNAAGLPRQDTPVAQSKPNRWQGLGEALLHNRLGSQLERWEMNRKIKKLNAQEQPGSETRFSATYCKGHFNAYQRPTLTAYKERVAPSQQMPQSAFSIQHSSIQHSEGGS